MNATQLVELQETFLFRGLDHADYSTLIQRLAPKTKSFAKGETIYLQGSPVQHVGVVLTGTARGYLEHVDGQRTIMAEFERLSVFGEVLVSTRTHKSPVTISALTAVTAAFIEYNRIFSASATACAGHSLFVQNLLKALGDKFFQLFDRINLLREKPLRNRIMAYLLSLRDGEATCVQLPHSKTWLAEYLLVNRSALSHELHQMARDQLITVSGRDIQLLFLMPPNGGN